MVETRKSCPIAGRNSPARWHRRCRCRRRRDLDIDRSPLDAARVIVVALAEIDDGRGRNARAGEIARDHDIVVALSGIDHDLLDVGEVELDAVGRVFDQAVGVDVDVEIAVGIESGRDADVIVRGAEIDRACRRRNRRRAAVDHIDAVADLVNECVVAAAKQRIVAAAAGQVSSPVPPTIKLAEASPVRIVIAAPTTFSTSVTRRSASLVFCAR